MRGGAAEGSPRRGWNTRTITQNQKESIEKERGFRMGAGARGVGDGSIGAEGDLLSEAGPLRCAVVSPGNFPPSSTPPHLAYSKTTPPISLLPLFPFCVSVISLSWLPLSLYLKICSAFFDRGNSLLYLARALSRFWEGEKKRLKWQQGIHLYSLCTGMRVPRFVRATPSAPNSVDSVARRRL